MPDTWAVFYPWANHLSGRGCKECGSEHARANKAKPWEEVETRFKERHGGFYKYDIRSYTTVTTPMRIICPDHGEFYQRPADHYHGGCQHCANVIISDAKKLPVGVFLSRAVAKFGDKYTYENYIDMSTNVTITCPDHGEYEQKPIPHIDRIYDCGKIKWEWVDITG